jgi:hypothetical protein
MKIISDAQQFKACCVTGCKKWFVPAINEQKQIMQNRKQKSEYVCTALISCLCFIKFNKLQ